METASKQVVEKKVMDKPVFSLPTEVIQVEFIKRQKGQITNTKHVLYGGMSETAKRRLTPIRSKVNFKYIQILAPEEQGFLETALSLPKDGLSVYKVENNYWDTVYIDLFKEGISLHLSDPIEYIKYKVILSYTDLICPSLAEMKLAFRQTYMFVIVHSGDRANEKVSVYNVRKEAYKIAAQLELNPEHIKEFLYLAGVRSTGSSSITWLKEKLADMVEEQPQKVIDIVTAADYPIRALLSKAVLAGVVRDNNGRYSLEDGLQLCGDGETANLATAIKFLSSNSNADVKLLIEAKLGK